MCFELSNVIVKRVSECVSCSRGWRGVKLLGNSVCDTLEREGTVLGGAGARVDVKDLERERERERELVVVMHQCVSGFGAESVDFGRG